MSFPQEFPYPVFIGTGSVATSGGTESLKPGQLALVNTETYQALPLSANRFENPEVLIASGSWHTTDILSKFIGGLTQSVKTMEFLGSDVQEFHRSKPLTLKQDVVQIGWDGVNACDSLSFECGKSYFFKVSVSGEDVFRTFSRPLYRFIELRTECCPDSDCVDGNCSSQVSTEKYTRQLADLINADPELKFFVKAEPVLSNYAATAATHRTYQLVLCDNGDVVAQAAVQSSYANDVITKASRVDATTTYSLTRLITGGAPANFTPTSPILLAVCGTCPAGYSSVAAADVYVIKRPVTPSTDLNDDASKVTYAATIVTAYSGVTGSGKFLGIDDGTALVQISVAAGTSVAVLNNTSDIILFSHSEPAKCTPPAGSAVAWTATVDSYKGTRKLCLTINKTCGSSNRLSDIQAFYANNTNVVANSVVLHQSGICADTYELQQYSDVAVIDDCLSPAPVVYKDIQSFEGFAWTGCPCGASTSTAESPAIYGGVRIFGAYADTKFGNCSFEPTDYYSTRPLRIVVSEVDSAGNPCSTSAKVSKLQFGQVATQTGEWLIRQYLKANSLEAYNIWSNDVRTRDVYDQQVLSFIDRTKLYTVYYVVYRQNRKDPNWNTMHSKDKFETIIAFPQGTDTSTFEQVFGSYFSQYGVVLKDRN